MCHPQGCQVRPSAFLTHSTPYTCIHAAPYYRQLPSKKLVKGRYISVPPQPALGGRSPKRRRLVARASIRRRASSSISRSESSCPPSEYHTTVAMPSTAVNTHLCRTHQRQHGSYLPLSSGKARVRTRTWRRCRVHATRAPAGTGRL